MGKQKKMGAAHVWWGLEYLVVGHARIVVSDNYVIDDQNSTRINRKIGIE